MTTTCSTRPADFVETLNPEYDRIRAQWAADGFTCYQAECEECGTSLAGAHVVEHHGWFCAPCARTLRNTERDLYSDEALQAWERKQMGLR